MSIELLSPEVEVELDSQDVEEDKATKDLEQEIECPSCSEVMTLSSDFDRLLYFCQECHLSLVMKWCS
jgi:C4-type Zn-finger protein